MTVVVDTSALYAVVDADDARHHDATTTWSRLADAGDTELLITNYVVVEVISLISRRLGMEVARQVQRVAIAAMTTCWTTPLEHAAAMEAFLGSGRALSFVDCATMVTMRARELSTIFTFDDDFARAGFRTLGGA